MKIQKDIIFVFFLLFLFLGKLGAQETASQSKVFLKPLITFARLVVAGNRDLFSAAQDAETNMLAKHKALAAFSPQFSYSLERSKASKTDFNSITGVEEDYSSESEGYYSSISQRTPLGRLSYEYANSESEYTGSKTSYFNSLYLNWQTGLFRNDWQLNSLERRMAHANYDIGLAQADSILLDILQRAMKSLFDRMLVVRNETLKKDNLSFYETMVEEAQVKLKNGMGSELDLKQASMRYRQSETDHEETILSLKDQDRRIGLLLGNLSWNRQIAGVDLEELLNSIPDELDEKGFLQKAYKHRPDYRLIENQYKLRKSAFKRARISSRPDISARLRWGKQGRSFDKDLAADMKDKSWSVSVTYSTSLGPEEDKIDFTIEKARLKGFAAKFEQKKDDVKVAINQAIDRFKFYRKNLASLKASQKLAKEVLDGQRLNFQLGKISLLDLTRYQQDFNSASLAVVQGESRLMMSWLDLLYESGVLADYLQVNNLEQLSAMTVSEYEIEPLTSDDEK
ncbi:MAG: TolC family protein [Candidatus Rifleibacteriota bacterium]